MTNAELREFCENNNTDNVEAFLFELNELLERHKAVFIASDNDLKVVVRGQSAEVCRNIQNREYSLAIIQKT